jgi:hypothetical protein
MMLSYPYPEGNHGSPKIESGSSGSESGNHDSNNGHPFLQTKTGNLRNFIGFSDDQHHKEPK